MHENVTFLFRMELLGCAMTHSTLRRCGAGRPNLEARARGPATKQDVSGLPDFWGAATADVTAAIPK